MTIALQAPRIGSELELLPRAKAVFIEPMLLQRTEALPEGATWLYELKFDGYRALGIKTAGRVQLRSRNDNDFTQRYPAIVRTLEPLPEETVIDGEVVALDECGRPSFNILQNYGSSKAPILYYVFDVLVLAGRDVMGMPLSARRDMLERRILPKLGEPIRYSPELQASLADLIASVRAQGLEGLVAKRRDSRYEPGQRSGEWQKMRINKGQEFVIAGSEGPKTVVDGATVTSRSLPELAKDRVAVLLLPVNRRSRPPFLRRSAPGRIRHLEDLESPAASIPISRAVF